MNLKPGWSLLKRQASTMRRQFGHDWQIFARNRLAILGVILIVTFGMIALVYPILRMTVFNYKLYDPVAGFDVRMPHPSKPGPEHLLGTDSLGHDVLSMLLAATAPTFIIGIAAAVTAAAVSSVVGLLSAYYAGAVDAILMQIADAFLLLPAPLFMVIMGMRFPNLTSLELGIIYGTIAGFGGAAILVRAQALQVMAKPFISAARVAGGSSLHIIFTHLLIHVAPLVALQMMLTVTGVVVADGFIAFFGFTRNYLNWGAMIYSSFVYSYTFQTGTEWHVLLPPAIALSLFAAAFYFVSRGLQDITDPYRKHPAENGKNLTLWQRI